MIAGLPFAAAGPVGVGVLHAVATARRTLNKAMTREQLVYFICRALPTIEF